MKWLKPIDSDRACNFMIQMNNDRLPLQTVIFMGCKNGEIEIGMSNGTSQIDFEIKLKRLFPGDFPQEMLPQPLDQGRVSSSSSSLRSLSIENGSEYSPFLFNMLQTTSYIPETIFAPKEAFLDQQAPNQTPASSRIRSQDPLQQVLDQIRSSQLMPLRENEEAAMTRAILTAISSSPSPCSSSSQQLQTPHQDGSAFKRYRSCLGPTKQRNQISRQNLSRRSLTFFRNLSEARAQQDRMFQTTRPTTSQLHHMISERKRREKLNESFQALRSLLPSGSKKDKASVLSNTKEYIASLKSQVEELNKRNKILESGEHSGKLAAVLDQDSGERVTVRIRNVSESSSESRVVELEVHARGNLVLTDLVIRMLEFIKQVEHATVVSVDAGTPSLENGVQANRVVLRLRIQGSEWDESSFQEAVRRILDDVA
ncbi:Myc-type, basic helix-loop-helix (bHLH) domain-containing protein [Cynara cardunculus var. scolymus]|uniref:Myc-type, basic helix-loop-helix (BHLH) domain-containing protein n=1 Tax=Cynara cardunculus var. scolymus TaxID=59895 RepID=A0A118K0E7_CYNCS|nr:Myc-type, basic helix-loop-helix (bHLH) domain-containing protein [Cynara cardunculus var. scolymus]